MEVKRYDVFASETIVEMKLDVTSNIDHAIILLLNASQVINDTKEAEVIRNMRGLSRVQEAIKILQIYEKRLDNLCYPVKTKYYSTCEKENDENNTLCVE